MNKKQHPKSSLERLRLGKAFEQAEKSGWLDLPDESPKFEAPTVWEKRRGRVDIMLPHPDVGYNVLIEIKATDWDAMAPHRVRPNALRHARQLWRYIEAGLAAGEVAPALVYPVAPADPERKQLIESILEEVGIQVVWREDHAVISGAAIASD